jgi:hypothetical protein
MLYLWTLCYMWIIIIVSLSKNSSIVYEHIVTQHLHLFNGSSERVWPKTIALGITVITHSLLVFLEWMMPYIFIIQQTHHLSVISTSQHLNNWIFITICTWMFHVFVQSQNHFPFFMISTAFWIHLGSKLLHINTRTSWSHTNCNHDMPMYTVGDFNTTHVFVLCTQLVGDFNAAYAHLAWPV